MINKGLWSPKAALVLCAILLLGLMPLYTSTPFVSHIMTLVFINVILAVSLRLSLMTGQFNVSHVAFFAIGAYSASILAIRFDIPTCITLLLGGLIAALISIPIGLTTLRLRDVYFALVSIAVVECVRVGLSKGGNITGGVGGLGNIHDLVIFGISITDKDHFYLFGFILMLITIFVLHRLEIGRLGMIWKGISQSHELSTAAGISPMLYKTIAFAIGCFFAGMAGALFAHFQGFLLPTTFGFFPAVKILIFCYVGGTAAISGPIIGATFLTLISEYLRGFTYYEVLFFSLTLMVVIVALPGGLITLPDKLKSIRGSLRLRTEKAGS